MKQNVQHRAALEAALQTYLSTAQPLLRQQALREAERHLVNPSLLLEAPQLTARHPLRTEALVVADAFEAVTNGMTTAEVMDPLTSIGEDSLFAPWKHLVVAIHFFYEGLDEATTAHLTRIPTSSPLHPLARALGSLCDPELNEAHEVPGPVRTLAALIHTLNPELASMAQQLTDALESGAENAFWSVLADLLEECGVQNDQLARRITLWVWNQLEWLPFDEASLLDITQALWGRSESSRLAALGSLAWDAEGAALLWARFLVQGLREDCLSTGELQSGMSLLGEFYQCALEAATEGLDAAWKSTWMALNQTCRSELRLRGLSAPDFPLLAESAPVYAETPRPLTSSSDAQLDLFAS